MAKHLQRAFGATLAIVLAILAGVGFLGSWPDGLRPLGADQMAGVVGGAKKQFQVGNIGISGCTACLETSSVCNVNGTCTSANNLPYRSKRWVAKNVRTAYCGAATQGVKPPPPPPCSPNTASRVWCQREGYYTSTDCSGDVGRWSEIGSKRPQQCNLDGAPCP